MKVTVYSLSGDSTPLSWKLPTRHTHRKSLLHYDEKKDESRALRYASNQRSFYEDEQKGEVVLEHVFFDDGELKVPQNNPLLRKFLAIHPDNVANGGSKFYLVDPVANAKAAEEMLDMRFEAMSLARQLPYKQIEAVMREVKGDIIDRMESAEIKRDLKYLAQNDPEYFLSLVDSPEVDTNDDIARIIDARYIQVRKNGIFWNTDGKKNRMVEVPFETDPMLTLEHFFMYDKEGLEIYKDFLDRLNEE